MLTFAAPLAGSPKFQSHEVMGEEPWRDWSVNATESGTSPEVVSAVKSATGGTLGPWAVMKSTWVSVSLPLRVVTVSETVYAPGALKMCEGF